MPRDRTPNKPIGTCECPTKGCSLTCKVYRFRQRNEKRTRLAGLLYLECPDHGRIGTEGKKAVQEYILEHGKIDSPPAAEAGAPITREGPTRAVQGSAGGVTGAPADGPASRPLSSPPARSWLDRLKTALD